MVALENCVRFKYSEILLIFGLLIYIAQIPFVPLQVVFVVVVGFYLMGTLAYRTNRFIRSIAEPRGHLLVVIAIFVLYVIFALRKSVHQEPVPFVKALLYGLSNLLFFFALQIYGKHSKANSVRLVRSFVVALLLSFLVYLVGLIFPLHLFAFRYFLYGSIFEQMQKQGSLGISELFWSAGLTPYLHLFGYQVAAGAAFIVALFMTAHNNRVLWAILTLLSFTTVVVVAQRSVLPALSIAAVAVLMLKIRDPLKFENLLVGVWRFLLITICIALAVISASVIIQKYYGNYEIRQVHERIDSEDVWTRLNMQLASLEIISTHPFGLFIEGRPEEDWGFLAENLGYDVVPDANQIDYALVHNAYLRIVMYLGWSAGVLMLIIIVYLFREILYFRRWIRQFYASGDEFTRYGIVATAAFVSLITQALFHNDSIFTFERSSWASLSVILIVYSHLTRTVRAR